MAAIGLAWSIAMGLRAARRDALELARRRAHLTLIRGGLR
jgi:hypothetical protein